MSFPFLIAHQIYPHFFNLGGRLSPVSIRDQMVRAQALVDDAVAAGLIGREPWRPLLVVGAGAAGATAASWAAVQHGVPTLLIERDGDAFNRQATCTTRWLDPTQYDWPVDHWPRALYPCVPVPTLMPWVADRAHHLAVRWKVQLRAARRSPWLQVAYRTVVASGTILPGPSGPIGWRMMLSGPRSGPYDCGMVLWTVGFGAERCDFGDYVGFPFWETDPFEQPNCGLPHWGVPVIVISGSGDGALQDFLRLTTNLRSAEQIYPKCGLTAVQRERVETTLASAEDLAQRGFLWGPERHPGATVRNDHHVLQTLHRAHESLALAILNEPGSAVATHLDALIRKDLPSIRMIHSCDHFSNSYGLNRFLVLLIGAFLQKHRGRQDVFIPHRRVAAIAHPSGAPCTGKPHPWLSCHGLVHQVDLEEALDCRHDPKPAVPAETLNPNVLIIRHGINTAAIPSLPTIMVGGKVVPSLPDIALPRQMTPYHALN